MTAALAEGYAPFEGHETWYGVAGDLDAAGSGNGPAPLVTLHGGPGATHDYLLAMTDLARDGRAVVFYDQTGNGKSAHFPDRGDEYYTVELFQRELDSLVQHLGIGGRYHVLGQSWGGMLAGLAPEVEAVLRKHEAAGTTDDPEYEQACDVYYHRHLCRLETWPAEVTRSFDHIAADPTVYHTTNGPSEFHVIGSFKNWSVLDRLHLINVPALVISGLHDEATPRLQQDMMERIPGAEQVILEESSHLPFWEERDAYMAAVGDFLHRHD